MTRADLIKQLMQLELPGEQTLTRAEARRLVTGFFNLMAEALRRGEEVEMPFGRLEVAEHEREPVRAWILGRVRVTYRKRKFVRFVPAEGWLSGETKATDLNPDCDPVSYVDTTGNAMTLVRRVRPVFLPRGD